MSSQTDITTTAIQDGKGEIVLYQPDETIRLEVRMEGDTVWLSQAQMAELFETTKTNITIHVGNVYKEKELCPEATSKESLLVEKEGNRQVKRKRKIYNQLTIRDKIYEIRGQRVMLDFDLAAMYGVLTGRLNEQVKRNIERFPEDFMFKLTKGEWDILKSQIAISKPNVEFRYLATSLPQQANADVAQLRKDFEDLKLDIEDILHDQNDINESTRAQLDAISEALAELQAKEPQQRPRRRIGFIQDE